MFASHCPAMIDPDNQVGPRHNYEKAPGFLIHTFCFSLVFPVLPLGWGSREYYIVTIRYHRFAWWSVCCYSASLLCAF